MLPANTSAPDAMVSWETDPPLAPTAADTSASIMPFGASANVPAKLRSLSIAMPAATPIESKFMVSAKPDALAGQIDNSAIVEATNTSINDIFIFVPPIFL